MIYLDNAATTPISKEALNVYVKASEQYFANPSSLHEQGEKTKLLLENCRKEVGRLLSAKEYEIFFTSGGSEANTLALESLFIANRNKGNHVITSQIEHASIHSFFLRLEQQGVEVTYLSVDSFGRVDLEQLKNVIRPDTVLASIQHVNSEIGTIQDIKVIGDILRTNNVLFHSDCVQSFTKLPIKVDELPVDALSVSSHKVNGPKGVGAVYISSDVSWSPVIPHTTHEYGFRQGTVNTPGIAAFTTAADEALSNQEAFAKKMWRLRNVFFQELTEVSHLITVEGDPHSLSPHIIGMGIRGIEGQYVLLTLDRYGICISTGSACQAGKQEPSATMQALDKSIDEAKRFFRISLGINNTEEDMIETAQVIKRCIEEMGR